MSDAIQFTDGDIDGVVLVTLPVHRDERGWLMELYRADELPSGLTPVMGYVSQTLPGVLRGPHAHRHQTDQFLVIPPNAFEFCLWDARTDSPTFARRMVLVVGKEQAIRLIVPPRVVHAYRNVSDQPASLMNFPDALYAGENRNHPVDEIRYENVQDHPFHW